MLSLIGRSAGLFDSDMSTLGDKLQELVTQGRFLVLGGGGSIGQAVVKELFSRSPAKLHVVDVSENNLVELVRDVRSEFGYIQGDFKTFSLDIGSIEYEAFVESDGEYDYVLNLSALKHVRSEKDPFTLMRMINVNVLNTDKTIKQSINSGVGKYFCVSTDKAANPVNMMGASKRIMEMFLMRQSERIDISTARFANVAFSDGSLLHGFNQRLSKSQPIVAPNDVRRYFVTPKESGQLCLVSCLLGDNRDILFPKLSESLHLITFSEIAVNYLKAQGLEPYLCESEQEAREKVKFLPAKGLWPCLFAASDTTGEKDFEEFFTNREELDMERFHNFGVIKNPAGFDVEKLSYFEKSIAQMKGKLSWSKSDIVELFHQMIPDFEHKEMGRYLDSKM
jgi:FlaA1/EpsC-like NDP-sugar epimerase